MLSICFSIISIFTWFKDWEQFKQTKPMKRIKPRRTAAGERITVPWFSYKHTHIPINDSIASILNFCFPINIYDWIIQFLLFILWFFNTIYHHHHRFFLIKLILLSFCCCLLFKLAMIDWFGRLIKKPIATLIFGANFISIQ